MAKIKITESELKQIISESVKEVINERNKINEGQSAFQRRYKAYNDALNNYNTNFAKNFEELSPVEKEKLEKEAAALNAKTAGTTTGTPITAQSLYTSRKNSALTNYQSALNRRGVGTVMKTQLDAIYQKLGAQDQNTAIASIDQKNAQIQNLNNAISQIDNALMESSRLNEESGLPARRGTMPDEYKNPAQVPIGGLDNILAKITNLKQQAGLVPGLQNKLAAVNQKYQNLLAQQKATPKPTAPTNTLTQQPTTAQPSVTAARPNTNNAPGKMWA